MSYAVKEIFLTLQGEGARAGTVAVFCRFAGCNLWSGREEDRADAICKFCDTDFVGGTKYETPEALADAIVDAWGPTVERRLVVLTGGEPMLQVNAPLTKELKKRKFVIALETNGTQGLCNDIDWICVSPKAGKLPDLRSGTELKLPFPQEGAPPHIFQHWDFHHFILQPIDGPDLKKNTDLAVEYCLRSPQWRLGLQTHKLIGIR